MGNLAQHLLGLIIGFLIGGVIWRGWETFRDRFLLTPKSEKQQIKKLNSQKKSFPREYRKIMKYYKKYSRLFNRMTLDAIQDEYKNIYEALPDVPEKVDKKEIIKFQSCGRCLIDRMQLEENTTPEQLYNIICRKDVK